MVSCFNIILHVKFLSQAIKLKWKFQSKLMSISFSLLKLVSEYYCHAPRNQLVQMNEAKSKVSPDNRMFQCVCQKKRR